MGTATTAMGIALNIDQFERAAAQIRDNPAGARKGRQHAARAGHGLFARKQARRQTKRGHLFQKFAAIGRITAAAVATVCTSVTLRNFRMIAKRAKAASADAMPLVDRTPLSATPLPNRAVTFSLNSTTGVRGGPP
jgi:hypothetical protein